MDLTEILAWMKVFRGCFAKTNHPKSQNSIKQPEKYHADEARNRKYPYKSIDVKQQTYIDVSHLHLYECSNFRLIISIQDFL